jgi:hypothetical protein
LGLLLWQRKKYAMLKKTQVAAGPTGISGPAELGGLGVAGAAANDVNDGKRKSKISGVGVAPASPVSKPKAAGFPERVPLPDVAEISAPLSVEEKQELERRRAAELSGDGWDIPVEVGDGERVELEARRKVYELA